MNLLLFEFEMLLFHLTVYIKEILFLNRFLSWINVINYGLSPHKYGSQLSRKWNIKIYG
jgi:hypothetical protein